MHQTSCIARLLTTCQAWSSPHTSSARISSWFQSTAQSLRCPHSPMCIPDAAPQATTSMPCQWTHSCPSAQKSTTLARPPHSVPCPRLRIASAGPLGSGLRTRTAKPPHTRPPCALRLAPAPADSDPRSLRTPSPSPAASGFADPLPWPLVARFRKKPHQTAPARQRTRPTCSPTCLHSSDPRRTCLPNAIGYAVPL